MRFGWFDVVDDVDAAVLQLDVIARRQLRQDLLPLLRTLNTHKASLQAWQHCS